jgi:hypothetical protein
MNSTTVKPAPGPGAEALIKEARRRQRRRYAATGVAVAAVLAAAVGGFAGLHGASGPRPTNPPITGRSSGPPAAISLNVDSTVLMWPTGPGQDGTIGLDNLRTGRLRNAAPVVDPGAYQPIMLVSGWIVYATAEGVSAASALTGPTPVPSARPSAPSSSMWRIRLLGTALAFAPSATPGDVWLEYGAYDPDAGVVTVQSVPVTGGAAGPSITLPAGTQLVSGTDTGLLLEPRGAEVGGPFWLWAPGAAPEELPDSASAEGFAVSPRLAAYGTDCANPSTAQSLSYGSNFGFYACRTLRVLDVLTGTLKSFAAPPGTTGWAPTHGGNWAWSASEIAPSGKLMAAAAVLPPDSQGIARVFILHLTGPDTQPTAVPSSAAFLLSVTAWSPDSSWLFYQGSGQHMWAYRVPTRQVRVSRITCCQYAVMATINNPPG